MQTAEAHWEDDENNRRVALTVGYTRTGDAIEIQAITPKQVTFLCSEKNQPLRSVGVWTDRGREMLAHQLRTSGKLAEVEQQIETALAV